MAGITRFLQLTGLALSLLFCAATARAEAVVKVQADAARVYVAAEITTSVDRETAWEVLTDYNHWSEFIPDLLLCRVVSRPGEMLRLEQRGRIPWLPNFPIVMITVVAEDPKNGVRFQRVAGNVRALVGEWLIQGKAPVRLTYRSTVEPGFPMPAQASMEIFRHDAKVRIEALAREMARRAAARAPAR